MRKSSTSIIIDDFKQDDEEKISKLSKICGSELDARFYLEAADFNFQEAEKIFKDSQKNDSSPVDKSSNEKTVNVTIKFTNGLELNKDYPSRSIIWDIGSDIFGELNINSEFSIFIEELSKSLSMYEMTSMTFADLKLARVSFMILT